jgi:hypothetical protein
MAERHTNLSGLVLDPCLKDRHEDLRVEARQHELETVLDPRTVELSTPGGITRSGVAGLPWAGDALPHTRDLLDGAAGDRLVEQIVATVVEHKYSAVLAPTHYLGGGAADAWLGIDGRLTRKLRALLDSTGQRQVCIYYPLATSAKVFRHWAQRTAFIAALSALPIDAVWLRIHPFGTTNSGPLALRRYIEGCRQFHALGVPLVAEHTGTVGMALLAFGAVGGIESGITYGERYDINPLINPPSNNDPFSPPPRVYVERLGAFLSRDQANELFSNRQMRTLLACRVAGCCPRGAADMAATRDATSSSGGPPRSRRIAARPSPCAPVCTSRTSYVQPQTLRFAQRALVLRSNLRESASRVGGRPSARCTSRDNPLALRFRLRASAFRRVAMPPASKNHA